MLRKLIVPALMLMLVAGPAPAGIRAPGKYAGIVLFDRWDTCYLYSGIYLMYISEKTKEALRKYEGHSILLDAKEVYQPVNPGDGRIGEFKVLEMLGPGKLARNSIELRFTVTPQFQNGSSRFVIEVENTGKIKATVSMNAFAITLLGIKLQNFLSPSDGKSTAWLTRRPLKYPTFLPDLIPASERSTKTHSIMRKDGEEYYFDVEEKLPDSIEIRPLEKRSIALSFHLPKGEYDFLCGYGGGVHESRGLASNRVSFNIDEHGRALEVTFPPRPQRASGTHPSHSHVD